MKKICTFIITFILIFLVAGSASVADTIIDNPREYLHKAGE